MIIFVSVFQHPSDGVCAKSQVKNLAWQIDRRSGSKDRDPVFHKKSLTRP